MIAVRQEDLTTAKAAVEQALKLAPADKKTSLANFQKQLAQLPAQPVAPAPATPAPSAAASAPAGELTNEARRKIEVLNLIAADADNAKSAEERRKFLNEYLAKSDEFIKTSSSNAVPVWTLRAAIALELSRPKVGWEAGRKLLALGADNGGNGGAIKVLAQLERKSWLGETPPPDDVFPKPGQDWENSLGMKFKPVPGTDVLFCIWETRVQDFEAFVKETGHDATAGMLSLRSDNWKQRGDSWKSPGFTQTPLHPVCGVSWEDAKTFCQWLTKKERTDRRLSEAQEYRLPTDVEWSVAVGLPNEPGNTPKDKRAKIPGVYPWGNNFPPVVNGQPAGNYAGEEAKDASAPSNFAVISGYRDGFVRTAPVGSFPANQFGLFDLGGNVWEWCEDWYDSEQKGRVLRGASWYRSAPSNLLSSSRGGVAPGLRVSDIGFRCVLVVVSARRCST